jgi:hypothetical protein
VGKGPGGPTDCLDAWWAGHQTDKHVVTIAEPMTLVTDYALGTLCELCAVLLLKRSDARSQIAVRLWAFALFAVAAASYAGGTYHGFHEVMPEPWRVGLWKITTISMGVASFLLLSAAFVSASTGQDRRWLIAAASLKLGIYIAWMMNHDDFRFVIYDYGSTLAILMLLVITGWTHGIDKHRLYIGCGILVSIAAAAVQQSGFRLHRHFNHNDLMHVVQMGGMWLLYKGGGRLRDAGGIDVRQP